MLCANQIRPGSLAPPASEAYYRCAKLAGRECGRNRPGIHHIASHDSYAQLVQDSLI
jgi:hypothetical protein